MTNCMINTVIIKRVNGVKFATCIVSSRGLFLLSVYGCRYQLTLRKPILYLIFKHMRNFYWQGLSEGNLEQAQLNKTNFKNIQ